MSQNVILITVDSWRVDHCGFAGYERDVTPTLDELARDGLVFENAIAPAAATGGSVPAILTGDYVNPRLETDGEDYKERCQSHLRTHRTLPQRFRERGYETGAFTANPWTSRYYGYDVDFDFFEDFMGESLSSGFVEEGLSQTLLGDSVLKLVSWWQNQDMLMSWESYYDDVIEWIDRAEEPYFLWLFLVDVHMPYLPPKRFRSRSTLPTYLANLSLFVGNGDLPFRSVLHDPLLEAYDDAIRYTDEFLRELTRNLEARDDEPLLAIHGDHGEAFGENGVYGHAKGVSEEQVHVPLVIANGPTDTVARPFSLRRLPDLLVDLVDGNSVRERIEPAVWARTYDPEILVRGERWRYAWRPDGESTQVKRDGTWVDADRSEFLTLGRAIKDAVRESERERERIHEAVATAREGATL